MPAESQIAARVIGRGCGWSVSEFVCTAGPDDRCFEEQHEAVTIAAVMEGSFLYRSDSGASLMHPGAFLLGNHGRCFECGHDHSRGDRCIGFQFEPDHFAEVAATAGGTGNFKFMSGILPFGSETLAWLSRLEATARQGDPLALGELTLELIESVVSTMSGHVAAAQHVSARDVRRISASLKMLEQDFAESVDLAQLANAAAMSKYHFLRTFQRVVGSTPYRYLLGQRLRHAAVRIAMSATAISDIAFETGFGDLSTFNGHFRRQFGMNPTRYRFQNRRRPLN